jgi:energy coupling factor transporter S component ThiW
LYSKFKRQELACIGELIGTGLLGGLLAFPIAKLFMGSSAGAFFFVVPFFISTLGGSLIAFIMMRSSAFVKQLRSSNSSV